MFGWVGFDFYRFFSPEAAYHQFMRIGPHLSDERGNQQV